MLPPTPHDLHAYAHALWQTSAPEDLISARYDSAEEQLLLGVPVMHRRAGNWVEALHRYEQFWRLDGRTPRENTRAKATLPAGERNLGEWARYQRRFEEQLTAYQRARLDVSPAFDWDPHAAVWQEHLRDCLRHVEQTGGLPRLNGANEAEFALARWMGRQLRRRQHGLLEGDRARALESLVRVPRRRTPRPSP